MTDIMKQRLLGALLLLCVISITAVYLVRNANNSSVNQQQSEEQIEFVSAVEPITEEPIEPPFETKSETETESLVELNQHQVEQPVKDDVVLVDNAKPVAASTSDQAFWTIQLGSFSVKSNAQSLKEKAIKLGYAAIINQVETNNHISYRVRITPEHDRDKVDEIVEQLTTKLAIKPQVLLSNPENTN